MGELIEKETYILYNGHKHPAVMVESIDPVYESYEHYKPYAGECTFQARLVLDAKAQAIYRRTKKKRTKKKYLKILTMKWDGLWEKILLAANGHPSKKSKT